MKANHAVKVPPFFANTSDDLHCYEACLRMILKFFLPNQNFSWQQLDEITGKEAGKWSWPSSGLVWLLEHGFAVKDVGTFDYRRFVMEGASYLVEKYGKETAQKQIERSNIPKEISNIKKLLSYPETDEVRIAKLSDITTLMDDGWLICCNVNAKLLHDLPGYIGHFVLPFAYTENTITLHDPGSPAQNNWKIEKLKFIKAWAYPDDNAKGYMAIHYKGSLNG